jgi:hypothetical protein
VHIVPDADTDPAPQPKPGDAVQSVHDVAPARLYLPAAHIALAGVALVDAGGHM